MATVLRAPMIRMLFVYYYMVRSTSTPGVLGMIL